MPPLFKDMSDTELRVMECLWAGSEQQGCSIREICGSLYPLGSAAQYATVQKLLDRLEAKSFVRRDRSARAHLFFSLMGRDQFLGTRLGQLSQRLCGGSVMPLISQLVRTKPLSDEDLAALHALLREHQEDGGKAEGDT